MLPINVEGEFDTELLQKAVKHLQRAVEIDPSNFRYQKTLGEALLAARRYDDAIDHLLMAHQRTPEPRTAYLTALAYWRARRSEEAVPFIQEIGRDRSVGFARLDLLRGRIFLDAKRYAEAANAFADAAMLDRGSREPLWYRAKALILLADEASGDTTNFHRNALTILQSYAPTEAEADEWNFLIGRAYLALLYPVEALRHLERSRHGATTERSLLLGVTMILTGRRDGAKPWLTDAARDLAVRPRLTAYLAEIAGAPADVLRAMGSPDAESAARSVLDRTFLDSVFGSGAPEVKTILAAATEWTHHTKTQADVLSGAPAGRLFAAGTSVGSRSGDGATRIDRVAGSIPETMVEDDVGLNAPTTTVVAQDALRPRTHVDLGESLSEATTSAHRVVKDDDDATGPARTEIGPILPGAAAKDADDRIATKKSPTNPGILGEDRKP